MITIKISYLNCTGVKNKYSIFLHYIICVLYFLQQVAYSWIEIKTSVSADEVSSHPVHSFYQEQGKTA